MSALLNSLSNQPSSLRERRPSPSGKSRRFARTKSDRSATLKSGGKASPHSVGKEQQLVQQAISGDSTALEQVIAVYAARLYRTAFAVLRNKEDAEDALQDSWCRAYNKLQCFEGRSSLSTWLTRIVVNSALMIRRRKNVRPEASLDEILETQPERLRHGIVDAGPNPEQICAITEMSGLVDDQIRLLPPGLRAAFQLCGLQGHSVSDSIQVLGVRKSAFKSRISRARQKLANGLHRSLQGPLSGVSVERAV